MRATMLRSRWLYLSLLAVVVILYGRVFLYGPPTQLLEDARQMLEETQAAKPVVELDVDLKRLQEAIQTNRQAGLWLALWGVMGLGFPVAGIGANLHAVWTGRIRRLVRYRSRLPHLWSMEELGRLILLLVLMFCLMPFVNTGLIALGWLDLTDNNLWSLIGMFLLHGLLLLVVWGFASGKGLSLASVFGLSRRKGLLALRQGAVGYVAVFPWVFGLLWLIGMVCQRFGIQPPVEPIHELLFVETDPRVVWLTVVMACVVGPIAEEIFFRGVLYGSLRKHTTRGLAMLMSAGLFSMAHTNAVGFAPILLLGCFLAYLYERSGSLLSSVTAHILHNTFLVGLGLTLKAVLWSG